MIQRKANVLSCPLPFQIRFPRCHRGTSHVGKSGLISQTRSQQCCVGISTVDVTDFYSALAEVEDCLSSVTDGDKAQGLLAF